jgi:thioredoxin reductase (NADPH)
VYPEKEMPKPAILTVDDDPEVLRSIERDLRQRYAEKYRVLRADSGKAALEALDQLKKRSEPVALFLVDQRMPQMTGVAFLTEAVKLYPDAKRTLLTAYADTDAAIRAINDAKIHHYLLKPWDPPEQNLYPVLDDLLEDWQAGYYPPFTGLRILSDRWSPRSYILREFLSRHQVPFRWLDIERADRDAEVRTAVEALGKDKKTLPLVLFPDGSSLNAPQTTELAERIGLKLRTDTNFFDLIIIGGGPAGLAAAVGAASEGLKTLIVERDAPGGQAGLSSRIENYLGFPSGLSGSDLTRRAVTQARRFGVQILSPQEAIGLRVDGPYRHVKISDGSELACHALLLAMGVQWRRVNVPGVDRLQGAGVYYGAGSTEAASCVDEDVYIIGGANSAGQAAMNFSRQARRVVMLVRGDSLAISMSRYLIDEIEKTPNIHVELNSSVTEAHGETRLEAISVHCSTSGETNVVPASSLFIFIGAEPKTEWLDGPVQRDNKGFILSGPDLKKNGVLPTGWKLARDPTLLETSVPGVFAAGDVRWGSVKRVASGVGEGSIAIQFIHQYLADR